MKPRAVACAGAVTSGSIVNIMQPQGKPARCHRMTVSGWTIVSIQHRRKQAIEARRRAVGPPPSVSASRARADAAHSIDAHQRISAVIAEICSADNVADKIFHNIKGHIETDVQARCDQEKSDK